MRSNNENYGYICGGQSGKNKGSSIVVKLVELAGFVIVVNEVKMAGFVLVANVEEMIG